MLPIVTVASFCMTPLFITVRCRHRTTHTEDQTTRWRSASSAGLDQRLEGLHSWRIKLGHPAQCWCPSIKKKTTTLLNVGVPAQASEKRTKLLISDRADLKQSIKKKGSHPAQCWWYQSQIRKHEVKTPPSKTQH